MELRVSPWYPAFYTKEDEEEFRKVAKEHTIKELAEIYALTYGQMRRLVLYNKVEHIKATGRNRGYSKVDKIDLDKDYVLTHTITECAKKYGIATGTMRKVLTKYNLKCKKNDHEISMWASTFNKGKIRGVYYNMLKRCYNPENHAYKYYSERGIKVCDKWKNDCQEFYTWAKENGYDAGLQLDRIDTNGDYCPENCRWITARENNYNKRCTRKVTWNGETHNLLEWEKLTGIPRVVLADRIYKDKWDIGRALTTPKGKNTHGKETKVEG